MFSTMEFTGVGSFTRFQYDGAEAERHVTLDAQLACGPPSGLWRDPFLPR